MKEFGIFCLIMVGMLGLFVASVAMGWIGGAAEVAQKEFGAGELLRKYEWFKNASAALDEKKANIAIYAKRVDVLEESYKGILRRDWPRDERERHGQMSAELVGQKAAFNALAADYNAQMAKFNWKFCNAGDLPRGADVPLPREYKPYILD